MLKPDKGLFQHGWFWAFVLGPVFIALAMAWFFGLFDLSFSKSLDGVETFYERGKFFLAIAALSIPLGATFARMHSSEQTANLIRTSESRRKEDDINKLLENYFNYIQEYRDKFFGYENRFIFKTDSIEQPVKSFYYLVSRHKNSYQNVQKLPGDLYVNAAIESLEDSIATARGYKLMIERQFRLTELYCWAKREKSLIGLQNNDDIECIESHESLGSYFYINKLFEDKDTSKLEHHIEALSNLVEMLEVISQTYYYSSQIFYLHDSKFAQHLERLSYKITYLINYYNLVIHGSRSGELKCNANNEVCEFFGDIFSQDSNAQKIAILWYVSEEVSSSFSI